MNKNISFALQVLEDQCSGCGLCADSCTFHAIRMAEHPVIDPFSCRLCGSCIQVCPAEALVMNRPEVNEVKQQAKTNGIWVLTEVEDGALAPVSRELLGKATELSTKLHQPVEAILIGSEVATLSKELIAYGAHRVHIVESDTFTSFIEENYVNVLADLVGRLQPEILLIGATSRGRALSARLASVLQTGLTADCTDLDIDSKTNLLHQIRPAFGGNLMATIICPDRRPQMASVRPGVMQALTAEASRDGEIVLHDYTCFKPDHRVRLLHETIETICGESLNDASIIIGIGRGVKNKETVVHIRRWAEKLGAVVAGSRAAVEAGLVDASLQVGQTGHTISPQLYIAIGISGQIQHAAAITGAKKIIAINPDCTAPIFNVADYGWVASVEDVLPQLMNSF